MRSVLFYRGPGEDLHLFRSAHYVKLALLFVFTLLAGCASMLSDEEITDAYNRCVGRGDGSTLQAVYCTRAIDSGKLNRDELENSYAMRCRINQQRGRQIEAQHDCDSARQIAGLPVAPSPAPVNREPEPPPRNYQLVFNGLYCPRVMKDSLFNPDNEIFANVAIIDEDGRQATQKLPRNGIFKGVRSGSKRAGNAQLLWSGEPRALTFQIIAWERDDGGPVIDQLTNIAVDFALTRGKNTVMKGLIKRSAYRRAASTGAGQLLETLDISSQLSQHISSLPKALVGANNDLIGAMGVRNIYPDVYGNPLSDSGFSYHFYTRHRRGTAECRFYFQFR